jgi:hypothetical protein
MVSASRRQGRGNHAARRWLGRGLHCHRHAAVKDPRHKIAHRQLSPQKGGRTVRQGFPPCFSPGWQSIGGDAIEPPTQGFSEPKTALSHSKTMGYKSSVCGVLKSVLQLIKDFHAHTSPSAGAIIHQCFSQRYPQLCSPYRRCMHQCGQFAAIMSYATVRSHHVSGHAVTRATPRRRVETPQKCG